MPGRPSPRRPWAGTHRVFAHWYVVEPVPVTPTLPGPVAAVPLQRYMVLALPEPPIAAM
jgi:hypothetical protein